MAPKKLSAAMFAFAKANRKKLKSPTPAQKKIFAQYDAMVKAGDNPANPKPRPSTPKASTPKTSNAAKRKNNFDGVGPSDAQRRKDSSPASMAAARAKRKKAVDGVGPSDAQRRKDSSAEAMKPKQYKGGARSRPTGNARVRTKLNIPKKKNRGSRNRFRR